MMDLPEEMIMHILEFVNDKIYISMTTKLFEKMCEKVYKNSKNLNMNDPYDINKFYCKTNIVNHNTDIKYMSNHKCLNCMFYKLFVAKNGKIIDIYFDDRHRQNMCESDTDDEELYEHYENNIRIKQKFVYALLHQYCVTNNISNLKYLGILISKVQEVYSFQGTMNEDLITISFINKSQDILMILMTCDSIKKQWPKSLCARHGSKESITPIMDELKFILDNHMMSPYEIYKLFKNDKMLIIYDSVYQYLEKYIDPITFNYLKINNQI